MGDLTDLTELTTFDDDEQMYVVDDTDGTPVPRRVTWSNIKAAIRSALVSDTAYGSGWNGVTDVAASKNAVYDKLEALAPYITYVRRVKTTLTDKTSWSGTSDEQWGTEEATLDNALLPVSTGVTVYAEVRGYVENWATDDNLVGVRVEISLDGGSTWLGTQADIEVLARGMTAATAWASTTRIPISAAAQETGTVTGDIMARAMARVGNGSTTRDLLNGQVFMEVIVPLS